LTIPQHLGCQRLIEIQQVGQPLRAGGRVVQRAHNLRQADGQGAQPRHIAADALHDG